MQFTNVLYKIFWILFIICTEKNTVCMSGRERERERERNNYITIYIEKCTRTIYVEKCIRIYKNIKVKT